MEDVISQLCSLYVQTSKPYISLDLQRVIDKHSKVFDDIPKGFPPTRYHDRDIHLVPRSVLSDTRPYKYPYGQKNEINCMVEEMLEDGIIRPSQSFFSAPMVMIHRKDTLWCMCPNYRDLNKITIKDKFPTPIIDELLDELRGSIYFIKLDIHSGYDYITMKEKDIPKITFKNHDGHYQ